MLSDVSPWHIFIFVVLTLLVVGPKDLPAMLRKAGQFMAKLRGMANEFRASFDEMARQSELDELRKEVNAMRAAAGKPMEDFKNEFEGHLMQPVISTEPDPVPMITEPPTMEELESGTYLPPEFWPPRGTPPVKSADAEPTVVKAAPKAKKPTVAKAAPAKAKTSALAKAVAPKAAAPRSTPEKAPAAKTPAAKPKPKAKPKASAEPGA